MTDADDDILDGLFHNADSRIMPSGPRLLGPTAHLASPLV